MSDNEIMHIGVLGMRWGRRRARTIQNSSEFQSRLKKLHDKGRDTEENVIRESARYDKKQAKINRDFKVERAKARFDKARLKADIQMGRQQARAAKVMKDPVSALKKSNEAVAAVFGTLALMGSAAIVLHEFGIID